MPELGRIEEDLRLENSITYESNSNSFSFLSMKFSYLLFILGFICLSNSSESWELKLGSYISYSFDSKDNSSSCI